MTTNSKTTRDRYLKDHKAVLVPVEIQKAMAHWALDEDRTIMAQFAHVLRGALKKEGRL